MTTTTPFMDATSDHASIAQNQAARVLSPPDQLRRFARPGEGSSQWAHYAEHPAYAGVPATFGERLIALWTFGLYFGLILTKRLISYELIPAHLRRKGGLAFTMSAIGNVRRRMTRAIRIEGSAAAKPVLMALRSDGICVAAVPQAKFEAINSAARPLLQQLRKRRGTLSSGREFDDSRETALRTTDAALFEAVEDMLHCSGLLEAVCAYLGREARLIDINPQINDSSDDFWKKPFADLPSDERPARYFHKDASGGDVKAILYMSDVGPASGPFGYAVGSHAVPRTALVNWIEETNDQSGFSSTDPVARRKFMALPAFLRRKCAVGNDLLPGDETTDRLLRAEWVITAPRGHIVLFDTKGFHRGGMVSEGEREVLTCVLG